MIENLSMDDQFLAHIDRTIAANLGREGFSVEDLAKAAGISRSMLHRRLVKLRGISAGSLITEKRVILARELLERDVATISEIAYRVGFSSPSYFNKVFKKHFRLAPGDIKRGLPANNDPYVQELQSIQAVNHKAWFVRYRKFILAGFLLVLMAATAIWLFRIQFRQSMGSILILPFDDLSETNENQYFADGITEDILNDLYKISKLRVLSRTTSKGFSGSNLTVKEIADKADADNVLEGSIRRFGDKFRLSVQLIDARRDLHLWSANFDGNMDDVMGLQGRIALEVARKLKTYISDEEVYQVEKILTQNPLAYDHYLRARYLLHRAYGDQRAGFNKEGVMNCLAYYEKAIEEDPDFAEAYAGLANARLNLSAWGWIPISEGGLVARALCEKALEIDPRCAEAHAVLGAYYVWMKRRFTEGGKELALAVDLNPNFATAQQWYAQYLMITGPISEARSHLDKALELEPDFWVIRNLNSWIYYFEEKYDKGIEACEAARILMPGFIENKWLFFLNYAKLGKVDSATNVLQDIVATVPGSEMLVREIANVSSESGINGLFAWMIDINRNRPLPVEGLSGHPYFIAWWYAMLGHKEESLFWLRKNMENIRRMSIYLDLINNCPDFDLVRNDPWFLSMVEELGLTPYIRRMAK
jgi:TolB-like protein/AraC-like DNA-binding protein